MPNCCTFIKSGFHFLYSAENILAICPFNLVAEVNNMINFIFNPNSNIVLIVIAIAYGYYLAIIKKLAL
jgi:hypothetical protein